MQWATLTAVAALLAQNVNAQGNMLRFACSQLVVERTDPLVNPGMKYTPHLHQIVGGNSFNVSMDPNNDPALSSGGGSAGVLGKPGPQMLDKDQAQNLGEPACAYKCALLLTR